MQVQQPLNNQNKKQIYSVFLDISGSVHGSDNYWSTVKDVFQLYASQIKHYYFWDHNLTLTDKKTFQKYIHDKKGYGGNDTYKIAQECVDKKIKDIILLTDGQVTDQDVQKCDKILADYKFQKSVCYIISSNWSGQNINMSVTCPFTRNCDNKVYKKGRNSPLQTVVQFTPEDYKILDTLDTITLENFVAEYDKIQGLTIALNMGKQGNIPLKNNLVVMKNRLVKQLAKKKGQDKKQLSVVIREYLNKNDFNSAIEQMRACTKAYLSDQMTTDLQKKVSHLISLCGDLRGKYNIKQIKSNKMATAQTSTEGKIDQKVQVNDLSKNPIECPILNDEDVPQILIDQCQPLLLGIQKGIVDDVAACPLRILNYPDLKAKLKSRLSNYVGVMGIKANFQKDLMKNPFTQNRLLGGIPLGTHKSHVAVGNHTIAKLITGGKILGNLNLYYAVIWYLIQQGSIEYLKDIEKNAAQHLIFRLKNSKTYASMCGQAQFVTTQVTTDVAVWFCVNSGYLNLPTDKDTFRFHFYNIQPMIKIVELLGYTIDKGLMPHYQRTKSLLGLLSRVKQFKTDTQRKSFKNALKGLYQNGLFNDTKNITEKVAQLEVCSSFIPIDGPASQEQIKRIRNQFTANFKFTSNLTNQELYYFGNLVDPQKMASNYFLDYNFVIPELPKFQVNWKYGLKNYGNSTVKICPKTLRPFYNVGNNKIWQQAAEQKFNININELLKGYKYFQDFVFKYNKLPNITQLIVFYYNRYVEAGKYKTLPYQIQKWAKQIINQYEPLFAKIQIKDILKIFLSSKKIEDRIKIEQGKQIQKQQKE